MRASWIFAGSLFMVAAAAACSSSTSTTTTTTDAGPDGSLPVTDSGSLTDGGIPTDGVTKIQADNSGGGLQPPAPDGSVCTLGSSHYEFDVATKKMSFTRCVNGASNTDPYVSDTGDRILTDAQITTLNDAVAGMTVTKETSGGADKPLLTVSLTRSSGTTVYYDSFYSNLNDGKIYVDNIDDVFTAFESFAPTK